MGNRFSQNSWSGEKEAKVLSVCSRLCPSLFFFSVPLSSPLSLAFSPRAELKNHNPGLQVPFDYPCFTWTSVPSCFLTKKDLPFHCLRLFGSLYFVPSSFLGRCPDKLTKQNNTNWFLFCFKSPLSTSGVLSLFLQGDHPICLLLNTQFPFSPPFFSWQFPFWFLFPFFSLFCSASRQSGVYNQRKK